VTAGSIILLALSLNALPESGGSGRQDPVFHSESDKQALVISPYLRTNGRRATCGVYSFWLAARASGFDLALGDCLSGEYVDSVKGSSAANLQALAETYGIPLDLVRGATIDDLRRSGRPAILQLAPDTRIDGPKHWIVYLGTKGGKIWICDLPRPSRAISESDLLAMWTGNAIFVGPGSRLQFLLESRLATVGYLAFPIFLLFTGFEILARTRSVAFLSKSWMQPGCCACAILLMATSWAIAAAMLDPEAFLRNSTTMPLLACMKPSLTNAEVVRPTSGKAPVFVDARLPMDFFEARIPHAINFPIDSTVLEFRDFRAAVPIESELVVYCAVSVHQGGGLFFGGAEEAAVGAVVALAGGALTKPVLGHPSWPRA
jgi:rhodanese-related sulfurtransferase